MKVLAIDTSMAACSVALARDAEILASRHEPMERGHAEAIAPMVRDVLADAGATLEDVDKIAVTTGPGTFTGVRIGLSIARGLALASGASIIGIDSLHAIASPVIPANDHVLVVANARNDEAYAALYDGNGEEIRAPSVIKVQDAAGLAPHGCIILGTAADQVIDASGRRDLLRSTAGDVPSAAAFVKLGFGIAPTGVMPSPLYLRAPDAKPPASPPRRAPQGLVFEDLSSNGAELLSALHGQCFDRAWTAIDFRDLMTMPGAHAVIAAGSGLPMGFLVTREAAGEAEIITIGTLPNHRRRGVARSLLDHECTRLAAHGTSAMFIEVAASNGSARALYNKIGFAEVGRRHGYYERPGGQREDAIVMRRALLP